MQPSSMYWELVVGTVLSELLGVSNYMIINMLSTCVHLKATLFQLQIAKLTSMFEYESKTYYYVYYVRCRTFPILLVWTIWVMPDE
jgi:hypothetical protein